MSVYLSNRLEILYEHLKENLFHKGSPPFATRFLIVPTVEIDQWIRLRLASDLHIAMGIKTLFLDQALGLFSPEKNPFTRDLELTFALEKEIKSRSETELLALLEKNDPLSLCRHLVALWHRYGVYGLYAARKWEKSPEGWQQMLWKQIYPEGNLYERFFLAEPQLPSHCFEPTFHLFAFPHLSNQHFNFFQKLGTLAPLFFYTLSPCQEFWSEIDAEIHPLLLGLGNVSRHFAIEIEERGLPTIEDYSLPVTNELTCLQEELLHLHPLQKLKSDDSIEIHSFSTPHSEMRGLYHELRFLFAEKKCEPKDVLVLAPDIAVYEPFIRALFAGEIDFEITPAKADNRAQEALELMLALEKRRWSSEALLELFSHPLFSKKWGWHVSDLAAIRRFIEKGGIRWGYSLSHASHLLQPEAFTEHIVTWQEGLDRLFLLFAESESFEFTLAPLLGQLEEVTAALYNALCPFHDGSKSEVSIWLQRLKELMKNFISLSEEEEETFFRPLDPVRESASQELFSFQVLAPLLFERLTQRDFFPSHSALQAVRFSSINLGCALPFKVICLIGMNHDAFPRKERGGALDLLKKESIKDYAPSKSEFDRALFLEILLSVRQRLRISYLGRSAYDQSELPLCPLVYMLLNVLAPKKIHHHPDFSFDPRYFDGSNSALKNGDSLDYEVALSLEKKVTPKPLIFDFSRKAYEPALPSECTVEIKDLLNAVRRPLRNYFTHHLRLFFGHERELKEEEEFLLSPLHFSSLRKEALRKDLDSAILKAKREGFFPMSSFGALTEKRLEKQVSKMKNGLHGELITLHLGGSEKDIPGIRCVPPLSILYKEKCLVHLVGKIEDVTSNGLLIHEKSHFLGALRHWPTFVILNLIEKSKKRLIFGKEGEIKEMFEDPLPHLHALLDYYFYSKESPTPLFAETIESILQRETKKFEKVLAESSFDDEKNFLKRIGIPLSAEFVFNEWAEGVDRLYKEMKDAWF